MPADDIPVPPDPDALAKTFKAVSDPRRREALRLIRAGETLNRKAMAASVGFSQREFSDQVSQLMEVGLILRFPSSNSSGELGVEAWQRAEVWSENLAKAATQEDDADPLSFDRLMRALDHTQRVQIINFLDQADASTVTQVAEGLELPHYVASRHLAALTNVRAVSKAIRGNVRLVSINRPVLRRVLNYFSFNAPYW